MNFDAPTLRELDELREIEIETVRPDGSRRGTIVWPMVDGDDVFIRSWRGDRGYWFQSATEPAAEVLLVVDGRRLPVSVYSATDQDSVMRCSRALERKYAGDSSLPGMLRAEILGTTLRVEPRAAE